MGERSPVTGKRRIFTIKLSGRQIVLASIKDELKHERVPFCIYCVGDCRFTEVESLTEWAITYNGDYDIRCKWGKENEDILMEAALR